MAIESKKLGKEGEDAACRALKRSGYKIIERNYRCPLGEMDIVARDGKTLVFVEVKSMAFGSRVPPLDRVDSRKRKKLTEIARFYIKAKGLEGASARFDAVRVRLEEGSKASVDIIPNAFDASK